MSHLYIDLAGGRPGGGQGYGGGSHRYVRGSVIAFLLSCRKNYLCYIINYNHPITTLRYFPYSHTDYPRKRYRDDDRRPHEPLKRAGDYESSRNSDPDSRPVIFHQMDFMLSDFHSFLG